MNVVLILIVILILILILILVSAPTRACPPRLGQPWQVRHASGPGDNVGWWMSLKTLTAPVTFPFGPLYLDSASGSGFVYIGAVTVPLSGVDPLASFDLLVPTLTVAQRAHVLQPDV